MILALVNAFSVDTDWTQKSLSSKAPMMDYPHNVYGKSSPMVKVSRYKAVLA